MRAPSILVALLVVLMPASLRAQPSASPGVSAAPVGAAAGASSAGPTGGPPAWMPWPHGRLFGSEVRRPGSGSVRLCSFEAPVCVHGERAADAPQALEVLREAESAYHFMKYQARLPDPGSDGELGGSGAVDLYVTAPGAAFRVGFETPTRFPWDRAPVFALLDRSLRGCARATAVHRAVASAQLAEVDAGEAGATFSSTTAYLAMESTGCRGAVLEAMDTAQGHPERPLLVPGEMDAPSASPLLLWWLDAMLGGGAPGALPTALWYKSRQSTPESFTRFRNVPDLMTVFGQIAKGRGSSQDAMLLDLAVSRAFLGDRDDGQHFSEAAWLGSAGRVRFDSSWTYGALPRLRAITPLEPTGMVYVWVDLKGAPEHPVLGFRGTWEYPITMRWALVRVSPEGQEISRLVVTHQRGSTSADAVIEELEGAAGVLIVGMNNGEIDLDEPFHIDETPYEPHGGTIHVFVPGSP